MKVSRNYCFTVFFEGSEELSEEECAFYWAANLSELFCDSIFRYVIVNVEVAPQTGRIHWQGYMELSRPARYSAIKATVPLLADAHFEMRMGTAAEAIQYCSKTETRHADAAAPFVYGQPCPGQGFRSDLESLTEAVVSGKTTRQIAEELPGMYMRYHAGIAALQAALFRGAPREEGFIPRPWQQGILDVVSSPADDRTIVWVTDAQGGKGKTRLARHLVLNYCAIELSGKVADMAYMLGKHLDLWAEDPSRAGVVVFDITRAAQDLCDHIYTMAEKVKSGRVCSTKYQSRMLDFPPLHVIIFSNQSWDRSKFSVDRMKEIVL